VGDKGAATAVAAKKSVRTDKRRIVSDGLDMQLTRIIEETLRLDEEGKKEKKKKRTTASYILPFCLSPRKREPGCGKFYACYMKNQVLQVG